MKHVIGPPAAIQALVDSLPSGVDFEHRSPPHLILDSDDPEIVALIEPPLRIRES